MPNSYLCPMPSAVLKDYYKILEIPPNATVEEVKKAYRRMAFKYHPDANKQDVFTESYFIEAQEAYAVLSNVETRRNYDNELWLAGMTTRAREHQVVTPDWILKESIKLYNHMATVDVYRMNHKALYEYLEQLLNERHMATLTSGEAPSVNEGIVNMILDSTKGLKYIFFRPVADKLGLLAQGNTELHERVKARLRAKEREVNREKSMPYLVVLVTLLIVLAMYFWAKK